MNCQVSASPSMITWAGKHWFFYMGYNTRHGSWSMETSPAVGLAVLPQDRLAGLHVQSGATEGLLTTTPLINAAIPAGSQLQILVMTSGANCTEHTNCLVSGFGMIDTRMRMLPDQMWYHCNWSGGELGTFIRKTIQLRIRLFGDTRLYAFRMTNT